MYKKSIFWFRQDLRIYDNTGLFEAVYGSKQVLPIFILDTNILEGFGGQEDKKFGFIREALEKVSYDLQKIGGEKVLVFYGPPEKIISELVKKYDINAVFVNESYGTYGKRRDKNIQEMLSLLGVKFEPYCDFLLVSPSEIEARKVFTPYYKVWQKKLISTNELSILHFSQLKSDEKSEAKGFIFHEKHPYFTIDFGNERLEKHIATNYESTRNNLDIDGTSRISPYLRFGVFSIRQIYNKAKKINNECFIRELAWREFWWHIFYHFPETRNREFQEKRRHIAWLDNTDAFEKWKKGETGYPIVDAAMKQLLETNWMHGRARMIVASFLTKDLHIDWRLGDAYFKTMLLDYDEAVNLGNWQWSASVGADPKPLRIFSPILQSEKFSPNAKFIKCYLSELEGEQLQDIHNPLENTLDYLPVIVDHRVETKVAREMYKKDGYVNETEK